MNSENNLTFTLRVAELEKDPKEFSIVASEEELKALAERFDLLSIESLKGQISVYDKGKDQGVVVFGRVYASFIQRCIATLKPVPETLETDFELLLVDADMANRMDDEGVYLDPDAPEYDALEGDEVPLGEVLAQTLSINMNPYPRAEGAEVSADKMSGVSVNEPEIKRPNPFSILAKSRDES